MLRLTINILYVCVHFYSVCRNHWGIDDWYTLKWQNNNAEMNMSRNQISHLSEECEQSSQIALGNWCFLKTMCI